MEKILDKQKYIALICDDFESTSTKSSYKMLMDLVLEANKNQIFFLIIAPKNSASKKEKYEFNGNTVLYFKSGTTKNTNKFKRLINESFLSYKAIRYLKDDFKKYKVRKVLFYSPSIFWGPLVKFLKKRWKTESYLILRDIFPQWAIDKKIISQFSPVTLYLKFWEKLSYSAADRIGLQSENSLKWFKFKYKKIKNLEVLHNWTEIPIKNNYLDYESEKQIIYGGNIGQAQGISSVIEVATNPILKDEKVKFLFVGNGDRVSLVKKVSSENKNILYKEPVTQEVYLELMKKSLAGLFSLDPTHTTHNIPGKFLHYISCGLPVIGFCNKENDLIDICNTGTVKRVFLENEVQEAVSRCSMLLNDEDFRKSESKALFEICKKYFGVETAIQQLF